MVIHACLKETNTCLNKIFLKCNFICQQSDFSSLGRADDCSWPTVILRSLVPIRYVEIENYILCLSTILGQNTQSQYAPIKRSPLESEKKYCPTMMLGSLV